MKPFQINIELKTPLVLGKFPVALDSLVWHALFLHYGNERIAQSKLPILFKNTQGVFHASALQFGVHNNQTLIAAGFSSTGTMRTGSDLSPALYKPNAKTKKGEYTKLELGGGPYRNRITHYKAFHAPYLIFHGYGDAAAICEFLQFYVIAVGVEANRGAGLIGEIQWHETEEDLSLIDSHQAPSRVLPVSLYQDITGCKPVNPVNASILPPYRLDTPQPCVVPERVRRFNYVKP